MEQIYPPDKFPCSDHIPLKSYFAEFSKICPLNWDPDIRNMNKKQQSEVILNTMQIFDKKKRKDVIEACSIDLLTVKGECPPKHIPSTSKSKAKVKMKEPAAVSEEAKQLETVKVREELRSKLRSLYEKHKYNKEPYICQTTSERSEETNIVPGSEFAVSIRLYHPFELVDPTTNSFNNLRFSHEIILLGSNTLADLRDKILCAADIGLCVETEDPTAEICLGDAKEAYPSGFIFIENVFYNDTRHKNCINYSEVILQWAKEKGIGPLQTACLEMTRIDELIPRFGYPYVYQHQATCEHILVFSDAWLLTRSDALNNQDYPLYKGIQRLRSKHCTLCYASNAKWICTESDRLPHSKTFMCQDCLIQYNYKDGKKIGNFKLFPYFDRSRIT